MKELFLIALASINGAGELVGFGELDCVPAEKVQSVAEEWAARMADKPGIIGVATIYCGNEKLETIHYGGAFRYEAMAPSF